MFASVTPDSAKTIGEQNRVAVEHALKILGIPIVARHLGGSVGRRMIAHASSGLVEIYVVGQKKVDC